MGVGALRPELIVAYDNEGGGGDFVPKAKCRKAAPVQQVNPPKVSSKENVCGRGHAAGRVDWTGACPRGVLGRRAERLQISEAKGCCGAVYEDWAPLNSKCWTQAEEVPHRARTPLRPVCPFGNGGEGF